MNGEPFDGHVFEGTFDGNEKYIINLRIHKDLSDDVNDLNIGLFANSYGTIKRLGIVNCNVSGTLTSQGTNTLHIGGISGVSFNEINNCFVSGKVSATGLGTAKNRVGGISGLGQIVKDCYNLATITCKGNNRNYVGGICGVLSDGENLECKNCYNQGEIIGTVNLSGAAFAGGIVGITNLLKITNINDCYNMGNISATVGNDAEMYGRGNCRSWI